MSFWSKMLKPHEVNKIMLPKRYLFLVREKHPRILLEALRLHGVKEVRGDMDNPVIISWAKEVGGWIADWYKSDAVPWCGLFMAVVCKRAKLPYKQTALRALSWSAWGEHVTIPMLGDVLVFTRNGGGHVGIYVGEDVSHYHVLGGNQSDSVSISRISKGRLYAARRTKWKWAQPKNIRRVYMDGIGSISENEA